MSTSMPEFEMPAAVEVPPRPETAPAPQRTVRPAHTAEPDASDALDAPRRSGLGWRHLLVAGIIGAVVGAAIPGGIQIVERAAASADDASLRAVAMEYLTAIAEGRAGDATEMVPLTGSDEGTVDAVLRSADPIDDLEVRLVQIDGDIGSVEVRFSAKGRDAARTLEAERTFGLWRLTTSLAEPLLVASPDSRIAVRIGGVALPTGRGVNLYPGAYAIDEDAGPLVTARSEPFVIDGDPATRPEVYVESVLLPEVEERVRELGRAVVAACQAGPDCTVQPEAELIDQGTYVYGLSDDAVDVSVQLMAGAEMNAQWFEVRVRIVTDESGAPEEWLCTTIDSYATPSEPCPSP